MADLRELVERALAEDLGAGDVTSEATVPQGALARARIVQKEAGVVFGLAVVAETMRQCGVEDVDNLVVEGQWREEVPAEVVLASGPATGLLAAERTALNFLGHLSGIATLTARCVEAVAGTGAVILDTRKTTPGLRTLEKYAVRAGGATNHRVGLFDAILIKENHIHLAGGVQRAIELCRASNPGVPVEVEAETLAEVDQALAARAEMILLDNMSTADIRDAVERAKGRAKIEISGGVTLERIPELAATGAEFVSAGALTHSAPAVDISFEIEPI